MQMLWLIIWLETEMICSHHIAQETSIGQIKTRLLDHHFILKDLLMITGNSLELDQVWNSQLFPMDHLISTVLEH
jgi:hypothetical protein